MLEVKAWLNDHAHDGLLYWKHQSAAAELFSCSVAVIERVALEQGILPARYARQGQLLNCVEQLKLFSSRVVVVGCGGLGGYIVQYMARLGIGTIVVIDCDVFEEHNLNRQSLATLSDVGCLKVDVAQQQVASINPAIMLVSYAQRFGSDFDLNLLQNIDVFVDAVDSVATRLDLAGVCKKLDKPLVHGAIKDWFGQVAVVMPQDSLFEKIYAHKKDIIQAHNTLSFVPAAIAAFQVAQVSKILLQMDDKISKKLLNVDLLDMEFVELSIG